MRVCMCVYVNMVHIYCVGTLVEVHSYICSYVHMYIYIQVLMYKFYVFDFSSFREKPLAVYAFTSNSAEKQKITAGTSSGGVIFNDVMVQFAGKCVCTYTYIHAHT